jgi:hypothetical protein
MLKPILDFCRDADAGLDFSFIEPHPQPICPQLLRDAADDGLVLRTVAQEYIESELGFFHPSRGYSVVIVGYRSRDLRGNASPNAPRRDGLGIFRSSVQAFALSRYGAPSIGALSRNGPSGAREGSRAATEAQGLCLLSPPVQGEKRRIKVPSGCPFLWFLSFGQAKERNSPAGRDPHSNKLPR